MSTTTDASTVTGEAGPVGTDVSTDAGTLVAAATPLVAQPPTAAGTATVGASTPTGECTPRDGAPATGGCTAVDDTPPAGTAAAPADGCPAPESWLRIEKGSAGPEEIAALSVVLCERIAALRALAAPADADERPAGRLHGPRHRPHRSACWSGCWSC